MLLRDYISEIRQSLPIDKENISDRLIVELINQYRAIQIKNTYNNTIRVPNELTQDLILSMNVSNQSLANYNTNMVILESDEEVPNIINLTNKHLITNLSIPAVLGQNINYVNKQHAKYAGNGRFNDKSVFSFIDNNKLFIKLQKANPNIKLITNVHLEAVFENPTELYDYWWNWDNEYPITKTLWGYIKSNLLSNSFNVVEANEQEKKG